MCFIPENDFLQKTFSESSPYAGHWVDPGSSKVNDIILLLWIIPLEGELRVTTKMPCQRTVVIGEKLDFMFITRSVSAAA